jgi:hypothetical protein
LELHGIRTGMGNGIDEGMRHAQAALVSLRYLTNDQTMAGQL